jgi:hypothetical protein
MESFLTSLAEDDEVCLSNSMRNFCEVSNFSFSLEGAIRYKEGWIRKRSGGRFKHEKKCFICYFGKCCRVWTNKWLIVTDQYVGYLKNPRSTEVHEVMIIDQGFRITHGEKKVGSDKIFYI